MLRALPSLQPVAKRAEGLPTTDEEEEGDEHDAEAKPGMVVGE